MDADLVKRLRREPVKIGHLMGFDKLIDIHNTWIQQMAFSDNDMTLLGHRSSYKTTCLSIAILLIIILQPQKNIIFIRKTDDDVTDIVIQVANMLKSDEIIYIVKQIWGVDLVTESTMFKIATNLKESNSGAPQLLGIGSSGSLTGKHADIIFTDDIVNTKDRASGAERKRTKLMYMELQNVKNRNGRIFNTGTPWHKDDAISLMPNIERFDCYNTGLITREKLEEIRQGMTPSLFAANYELRHIADEDAMFENPQFTDKETLIYDGIGHIDAAYGGSDSTAYTAAKKVDGGYILLGKKWNKHVDDCLTEIQALQEKYRIGTIYCEKNADKAYLAKELRSRGMQADSYSEHTNKFIKISTYLRKYWPEIYFLEETDPDYINEILDYTEFAEHDDAPDSASCMIRKLSENKTEARLFRGGII